MNRQLAKQYFDRAEAALESGNPEEALTLLNQLDAAFPNTKNIGVARAKAYAAMGRIPEAMHLCDALIQEHDSRRAKELKARLVSGESVPISPKAVPANASRTFARRLASAAFATIAIASAIGGAVWFAQRMDTELAANEIVPPPSRTSGSVAMHVAAPASAPGQIHAPSTWNLDDHGVPTWRSGVFLNVPCINEPARTIDVYIPLAYDTKPDALFPGVVIQMPGGKPGFIGLEDWAERSEVILIVVNSSKNQTFAQNHIAQDRALETVSTGLRLDQRMGFAIGMSGGGRASWQVACRYPENFRGIVMMGISGDEDVFMPPPHVRIAIIHGETDFNNKAIARALALLAREGYQVREAVVPGGHVTGPVENRVEMLNWMVYGARRDLGLPQPSG